ncbi:MAG: hypothetical protein WBP93_04080 [Pyrinomonadaceae bacterium]
MIYCNECGTPVSEGLNFCTECGTEVFRAREAQPSQQSTVQVNPSAAPVHTPAMINPAMGQMTTEAAFDNLPGGTQTSSTTQSTNSKGLIIVFGILAIMGVAVIVYFAARSQSNSTASSASPNSNSGANSYPVNSNSSSGSNTIDADSLAASLNREINNGRLVTLTGDDAYTYFTQLRAVNPQHSALSNIKSKVLPQLRSTGEEIIRRKINHSGEVSEQDWRISIRVYEWAHMLEPGDSALEARQKYVQGKLAEAHDRRGEAWQDFSAAAQLDPSWAVPQNDLGFLTTQDAGAGRQKWSNSIPYYQRAIRLQPDWDIPYNNMGTAYYYLEDYTTAEGFYQQSIQRNSNWARPHKWLGDVYVKRNMYGEAVGEYQTALNLYNPKTDSLDIDSIQKKIAQLHQSGY